MAKSSAFTRTAAAKRKQPPVHTSTEEDDWDDWLQSQPTATHAGRATKAAAAARAAAHLSAASAGAASSKSSGASSKKAAFIASSAAVRKELQRQRAAPGRSAAAAPGDDDDGDDDGSSMTAAAASSPSTSSFDPPSALLRASHASRQQTAAEHAPRQPQWTGSGRGGGFGGVDSGQSMADERDSVGGSSFIWPGGAAAANATGRIPIGSAAAQSSAHAYSGGGGSSFTHHSEQAGLMPQPLMAAQAAQAAHPQQTLAQSSWQQPPLVRPLLHVQPARPIAPAADQTAPAQTLPAHAVGASAGQPNAIGMAPMPQHPASYPLPAYLQSPSAVQRAPGQREAQSSGNAWRG